MFSNDVHKVLFKVFHPASGWTWHATAPSVGYAQHFLRVSRAVMSEAGFVFAPIAEGEYAVEIPYILLVRLACEICFRRRFCN
jgi:hypothetical protein